MTAGDLSARSDFLRRLAVEYRERGFPAEADSTERAAEGPTPIPR
jgi:hypothetical protein